MHDLGKTVINQNQAIYHSSKGHGKCLSDMQYEADTIQEGKTRLSDQVKMMQKENSDITGELSNMVAKHVRAEEEILKLNTMASENIKAIEEMRK